MHRYRRPTSHRQLLAALVVAMVVATSLGSAAAFVAPASAASTTAITSRSEVGPAGSGTRGRVHVAEVAGEGEPAPDGPTEAPRSLDLPSPLVGRSAGAVAVDPAATAPVFATTTTAPPTSGPGWSGMSYLDTGFQPADPWVAVGPDHVVQVVNTSIRMWDRAGTSLLPATELSTAAFFDLPSGTRSSDPRVIFDARHGRWVLSQVSWVCDDGSGTPVGFVDFLVSDTADPTLTWQLYYIYWEGYLPDYPAFGTSTDKLAVASNIFELPGGTDCETGATYAGADVTVMDWADLLAAPVTGTFALSSWSWQDGGDPTPFFTPRVALQTPATSTALHVIVQYQRDSDLVLQYTKVDGSVVADTLAPVFDEDLEALDIVAPSLEPPAPLQPGGSAVTERLDARPTDAIYQDGRLAWVATNGCVPAGSATERTCVRVTEIRTDGTAAPPVARQDLLIGQNGVDHSFGGIGYALDGTLHVVWTRSADAAGGQPSSLTAYQRPGDPANSLSAARVLVQGTGGTFTGGRWGDYVGVAQDPQVPNAVWQGNTHATGGLVWATRVSQLQTGGATFVPIDPVRVLDSRIGLGVSGSFLAEKPRTWVVAGFGGIPAGAIAVTGNVTVTGQSGAGYVSITPTATATPGTSTINVPAGDTRANNVTATLARDGRLAGVYKRSAGGATHVIFDVTGYFVAGTASAGYQPATPTRFLDSRIDLGVAGPFRSGVPRRLDVAGVKGIPADAIAVTANVTVTRQTRGGFVSVTPTSQAAPATSTLNFPLGDTRANGLTAKLGGGDLWLVYKASSSTATAELVLDITGYYRPSGAGLAFYPLEPGRIMDTRTSVLSGLSGRFTSASPRRLDVDGHWGVPAGAKAITGNLTVTGQTGAGFVTASTSSSADPSTSTLNFPTGESRANGITVPLTGVGNEWFVYRSGSGRTTHLILDVTGYFR